MFDLIILTLEERYFQGKVRALVAPGVTGYFEILTNHAPIMALLKEGDLIVTDDENKEHYYTLTSGVFEIHHNQACILADSIQRIQSPHISLKGLT